MAGNRQGKHDIAPKIRAALLRACARKSKDGDPVSYMASMLERAMEDDFVSVLNAISKFTVREKEVNHTITRKTLVDILANDITTEIGEGPDSELESESGSVCH